MVDITTVTGIEKLIEKRTRVYKGQIRDLQNELIAIKQALNIDDVSKLYSDEIDRNYVFNKVDFNYSEYIKGVGKEYNYVSNKVHYFINGELVKILNVC